MWSPPSVFHCDVVRILRPEQVVSVLRITENTGCPADERSLRQPNLGIFNALKRVSVNVEGTFKVLSVSTQKHEAAIWNRK